MRRRDQLEDFFHADRVQIVRVALEHGLEWLGASPLRVLRGQFAYAIRQENDLEIRRLFGPQGAVVVERGHTVLRRHVVGTARLGHPLYELEDRSFGGALVPGG